MAREIYGALRGDANPAYDATRFHYDADGGVGDEVQITATSGGGLHIEICEPWAGDTETGFGATCSLSIPRAAALDLYAWLGRALA